MEVGFALKQLELGTRSRVESSQQDALTLIDEAKPDTEGSIVEYRLRSTRHESRPGSD